MILQLHAGHSYALLFLTCLTSNLDLHNEYSETGTAYCDSIANQQNLPEWFGVSEDDLALLTAIVRSNDLAYFGLDRSLDETQDNANTFCLSLRSVLPFFPQCQAINPYFMYSLLLSVMSYVEQQPDADELRAISQIIANGDNEWIHLTSRLQGNITVDDWDSVFSGDPGIAQDRYSMVNTFTKLVYDGKMWYELSAYQQRAVNYYLAVHHSTWGIYSADVVEKVAADANRYALLSSHLAQCELETTVSRLFLPNFDTNVRSVRRVLEDATDLEIASLAEYMYYENVLLNNRLADIHYIAERRRSQLSSNANLFSSIGGLRVARDRFGFVIGGYEWINNTPGCIGVLVAFYGHNYIQAYRHIAATIDVNSVGEE